MKVHQEELLMVINNQNQMLDDERLDVKEKEYHFAVC